MSSCGDTINQITSTPGEVAAMYAEHAMFQIPEVIEDVHQKRHWDSFQNSMKEWMGYGTTQEVTNEVLEAYVKFCYTEFLASKDLVGKKLWTKIQDRARKEFKCVPQKSALGQAFQRLIERGEVKPNDTFTDLLIKKAVRSNSGVLVITVLTAPGPFSCPKDCYYCPNEPGQPRSYLSTEPAVLRGNQNGWSAVAQFDDRADTLERNGHTIDKIEILVLGGTWSGYPKAYQEEFVRDLFYAANTFHERHDPNGRRPAKSLLEEQTINETERSRIIGLTLETRPDFINKAELRALRDFGCTRVQVGIQHTDDRILKHINRGCTYKDCIKAVKLLKDAGFKVDIHLMPDLPGSDVESDRKMFDQVLFTDELQADQWKIYPCEVTPFTVIEKWWKEGTYKPYTDVDPSLLSELLIHVKSKVHPWIRLNRVVRDIPNPSIIAGNQVTNLRQELEVKMRQRGLSCPCIRCREVRADKVDPNDVVLVERVYQSSGGEEIFLSFETADHSTIMGFLRLRLRPVSELADEYAVKGRNFASIEELQGAALVREVHVYGVVVGVSEQKGEADSRPQHLGLGRKLLARAEEIAIQRGYPNVAIISGIGAREYYRKNGYALQGTYMVKQVSADNQRWFDFMKAAQAPSADVNYWNDEHAWASARAVLVANGSSGADAEATIADMRKFFNDVIYAAHLKLHPQQSLVEKATAVVKEVVADKRALVVAAALGAAAAAVIIGKLMTRK